MKQVVLITGASSGIGEATARYLAEKGYSLILTARNEKKLELLKAEIGDDVYTYPCDLSKAENIEGIFRYCYEKGIKLDGLVHSAGVCITKALRMVLQEDLEYAMKVNSFSFVELIKHFGKKKYSAEGASIVAISSIATNTAYNGTIVYTASKAYVNACVKVASKELLKRKIRVNSILPGYVETPMSAVMEPDVILAQQPLGVIPPEQISSLIQFLLSGDSRFITGAEITVSGGMNF